MEEAPDGSALPFTYRHAFIWAGVLTVSAAVAMLLLRPARAGEALA